jgi:sarcosine oxidase delta subunit
MKARLPPWFIEAKMLLITCPICAITADETEFYHGGPAASERTYTRGLIQEWWLCEAGCGTWFGMTRHTGNQRIVAVWTPGDEALSSDERA